MEENRIQLFNNDNLQFKVRAIKNEDGTISVNAEDTMYGFGFVKTDRKNGKEYVRVDTPRVQKYIEELGFGNDFPNFGKDDYIPESLFYLLGMKANSKNHNAIEFQKWIAVEVIPSIRINGSYVSDNKSLTINANTLELKELVNEMKNEKTELGKYYRPTHKKKLDINKHIKNCLGVNSSRENADRVKEILLTELGLYKTYEEVPKDKLHSTETAKMIERICNNINTQFGQIQECMF